MLRNLAMLPPVVIREAVKSRENHRNRQERLLAPAQAAQIGLVWRRKLSGNWASWVDIDPFEVPSDQGATPQSVRVAEAPSFDAKKIEDGTHPRPRRRIRVHTRERAAHITVWFHNFVAITHGQPDEKETPTNEQLSALNVRVVIQLGLPLRRLRCCHALRAENHQSSPFHHLPV